MKRLSLLLIFLAIGASSFAQLYRMDLTARVRYSNNNVRCNSFFSIGLQTGSSEPFVHFSNWYQKLSMDEGDWAEYTTTVIVPHNNLVRNIHVRTKRELSNCNNADDGDDDLAIPLSWYYNCHDGPAVTGLFKAFDGSSSLYVKITPVSMSQTANTQLIQTDAFLDNAGNDQIDFSFSVVATYTNNSTETLLTRGSRDIGGNSDFSVKKAITKSSRLRIKSVRVRTTRRSGLNTVESDESYPITDQFDELDVTIIKTATQDAPFPSLKVGSYVRIRIGQPQTPTVYSPGASNILPSDNKITLEVSNQPSLKFTWQYQIENGAFENAPASFGITSKITFSGKDLFGATWESHLFKNITFKAIYQCAGTQFAQLVTLRYLPSSPFINSVVPETEPCNGDNKGKLKINFSRPLYENELLYIQLNTIGRQYDDDEFATDNSITRLDLAPGIYNITLLSTFFHPTTGVNIGTGYSDAPNHKATQTVTARPAINNLQFNKTDIHCFGGEDGTINSLAQGGTGTFTATLFQGATQLQAIGFTQPASNTFTGLKAGNYTVRIKDSNGCEPKDGGGNVIVTARTLTQPANAVTLGIDEQVDPLGFGLANGQITVRADRGTTPFQFTWQDGAGNPLTPEAPQTQGSSMVSKLNNLGKGTYKILAKDNQYVLASPQTEVNLKGCYANLTVTLNEPKLLEVAIAEKRFVSCNNDSDGELVAHSKGGVRYAAGNNPYQYEWFRVTGGVPTLITEPDSVVTDRPSGIYRIRVTDKNGIQAWSPDFPLNQPAVLKSNFNVTQLLCNGDTNGSVQSLVSGGTTPYRYAWNTEQTTASLSNLTDGKYSVVITDAHNCTTFDQVEITAPNGIEAEGTITLPVCADDENGSIALAVNGGTSPYRYAWQSGETTAQLLNIKSGNYQVQIRDANDCFIVRNFTVDNPALFPLELGPDRLLCKDQVLDMDVAVDDLVATYVWTRDGVPFASTAAAQLSVSGNYAVSITDNKGCETTDAININRSENEIYASIVVATRVPKDGKVRIANISYPAPDLVEWILPDEATVIDQQDGYVEVSFAELGEFEIGLTSFQNGCEKTVYATVKVVNKGELTDYVTPMEPYIKQFMVAPNPSNGDFKATVELREPGDYQLFLYNLQGTIVAQKSVENTTFGFTEFELANVAGSGTYMLRLVTNQGYSLFKVVIR